MRRSTKVKQDNASFRVSEMAAELLETQRERDNIKREAAKAVARAEAAEALAAQAEARASKAEAGIKAWVEAATKITAARH